MRDTSVAFRLALLPLLALAGCSDPEQPEQADTSTTTGDTGDTDPPASTGSPSVDTSADSTGDQACVPELEEVQALPATIEWPAASGSVERLRDYVEAEDPTYSYSLDGDMPGVDYTAYFIQMDSLQWRAEEEISPAVWSHWVTLIVPDQITTTTGHLVIIGGSVSEDYPGSSELPLLIPIAVETGSPIAVLGQIPAQPSTAPDRPEPLREDDLVAYSWRKAMDTQDPTWAAYFPMTKASVRAMDMTQEFMDDMVGQSPEQFIVTGFSKRGATAWLTAAADDRVQAVVPGVFGAAELADLAERQFQSYGAYAEAADSYVNESILQEIRSPEGYFVRTLVDPISYLDGLTMPHYVLQASGDEFFLADGALAYLHQIQADAPQRIVPNESHSLEENLLDNLSALIAWYQAILADEPRPQITEQLADGVLTMQTDQEPTSVTLWVANNPTDPDFRFDTIADAWVPTPLEPVGPQTYEVTLSTPQRGYDAHLVEFRYPGANGLPREQVYSSHVYITPDTRPYSLDQPLGMPTTLPQWRCELGPDVDPQTVLADVVPMVVRGQHIVDVDSLVSVLMADGSEEEQAAAQCAAARVNIELGELDWYTPATEDTYVWEHIASAEHENAQQAMLRCQALNNL